MAYGLHSKGVNGQGNVREMDGPAQEVTHSQSSLSQPEETERKARVDAVWQQMNKGISTENLNSLLKKPSTTLVRTAPKEKPSVQKSSTVSIHCCSCMKCIWYAYGQLGFYSNFYWSQSWMTFLGLAPNKQESLQQSLPEVRSSIKQNGNGDEAKRLAASALSAVKEAATLAAASGRGKVEITEVRGFGGEAIETRKLVDADSKEASDKAKVQEGPPSAVDAVLEQIRKKPKLSVLDKTKKDWGEFKEEKGLEEELDAYKKSGNQYLDKVSFLQRADYREFERERDARLALQAKRKPDT
ncbi:hypothetical protein RJ639_036934 [Escallonia herrerae]|uniref:BCNT-C domain-containing protein n=1 Tax=Escallonia herrerae TaxID=1293975 RepID=A0AA88WQ08_9ASTE|nr:hypothetical protein RJ639_036934 [Escallonia herrerae]